MALHLVGKFRNEAEKKLLLAAAKEVFLHLKSDFETNLSIVSISKIKELNSSYRGKDAATDVLSFKLDDNEPGGDILVCRSIARKEAMTWEVDELSMLVILLVHGMLHLAGFDHETKEDCAKMEQAETDILAKIGILIER